MQFKGTKNYIATEDLKMAVNAAITLEKPLLVKGEPGTGYCEETGDPISFKRLDARPIATLSLEAQERHERREKVHRDD